MLSLQRKKQFDKNANIVYLINKENHSEIKKFKNFLSKNLKSKKKIFKLYTEVNNVFFIDCATKNKKDTDYQDIENTRKLGASLTSILNKEKISEISIIDLSKNQQICNGFLEGLLLSNYQFLKYKKNKKNLSNSLTKAFVHEGSISSKLLAELKNTSASVYFARDLVNEPLSYLTAPQMAKEFVKMAKKVKLKVEIFNKKKLESLKMGGILAVNKGSVDPPVLTILEWKPKNAKNKKPLVFVGKGVVYDTGGLSLKPSIGMDIMKCDMGGAACVAGAMMAIAKNNLALHVIALIPSTDNRPGKNAYVPGDVIKMYDGTTVEVLNTDAEGRMLLADALAYAKKYKPMLVMDAATLTGASVRAIGPKGLVCMGKTTEKIKNKIFTSGNDVFERLVELPLWDEYKNDLKSTIADLKNIGGNTAGAITAGKFLEHFTDYDWMHFDIAPMAWMNAKDSYRMKDGSGAGVRLFYQIAKTLI